MAVKLVKALGIRLGITGGVLGVILILLGNDELESGFVQHCETVAGLLRSQVNHPEG